MAKRRQKKRTHVPQPNPAETGIPQSMVLRIGGSGVGVSLSQLVQDVRMVMQPHTAVKLRERKANKLRDYVSMAGPLGVSHLLMFSKTQSDETSLRIAHTPRGPTIHFRVLSYSLCKDLRRVQRHPRTPGSELLTPPLLVLNGFAAPDTADTATSKAHLTLMTSMFQNMFPTITASASALKQIKRVMMVNFDQATGVLDIRHYLISTKSLTKLSRIRVKKEEPEIKSEDDEPEIKSESDEEINDRDFANFDSDDDHIEQDDDDEDDDEDEDQDKMLPYGGSSAARLKLQKLLASKNRLSKHLPRLGKSNDIADFLLKDDAGEMSALTSESEAEEDDMFDGSVLNNQKSNVPGGQKKAVKLIEIGPRMRLKLIKIQEGVCEGDVLYHAFQNRAKKSGSAKRKRKPKV
ncbi:Brix domain-containing protein [Lipomyces arxii]|uniref:Brix domain-containing protein n=1 Tax=Lipomyces arxii TaxID=56418 RepID=UPI0034CED29E